MQPRIKLAASFLTLDRLHLVQARRWIIESYVTKRSPPVIDLNRNTVACVRIGHPRFSLECLRGASEYLARQRVDCWWNLDAIAMIIRLVIEYCSRSSKDVVALKLVVVRHHSVSRLLSYYRSYLRRKEKSHSDL